MSQAPATPSKTYIFIQDQSKSFKNNGVEVKSMGYILLTPSYKIMCFHKKICISQLNCHNNKRGMKKMRR